MNLLARSSLLRRISSSRSAIIASSNINNISGTYLSSSDNNQSVSNIDFKRHFSKSVHCNMKFVQFKTGSGSSQHLGVLSEDGSKVFDITEAFSGDLIQLIRSGTSLDAVKAKLGQAKQLAVGDVSLLAPVTNPQKILCVGLNYRGHCEEQNKPIPKEPMFFSKYASTIVGPFDGVVAHKITDQIDWEVELAVVIGKEAKHVSKANAMDYVFGYTVAQDISARDWQKTRNGGQFLIGKSMDTFCPLGPAVVHKSLVKDPHNLSIKCDVNGVEKQKGNTSELVFRIDDIIERVTQSITLLPGDVILTGTPAGVGMHRSPPEFLKPGDVIDSEIESLGKIKNKVVAAQPNPREPKPIEKPQVLKEKTLPVKSTAPSPVPKPKLSTPTVPQPKQKENSIPATPRDSTPNKPTAPAAKLPVKPAAPSPVRNPPHNAKQTETSPAPPAPSSDGPPPSPRSSRVRKVPLKFQDGVGFAMPKTVNIKSESEPQESPKEPPVRITRRSNAAEEKASESQPPAKPERKQPAVTADDAKSKQSKEGETPKKEPAVVVVRLTRSIEAENKKSEEQQKARSLKRKSDTRPDPVPPSKSPKVEQKRNSLDTSKTKQQQQKLKQEEQQQKQEQLQKKQQQEQLLKKKQEQEQLQKKKQEQEQQQKKQQQQEQLQKKKQQQEQLQKKQQQEQQQKKQQQEQLQKKQQQEQLQKKQQKERLQKKLQQQEQMKKQRHLQQLKKQKHEQQLKKQRQEQRVNGSRKDVPAAEVKKPKEPEPSIPPPVSSQDWKCPFCPDRVFDQKKRLVKHLRKRHGMDYALVRQRLAIYGGNWR